MNYSLDENLGATDLPEAISTLNRQILEGGKRLRPILCFTLGRMLGVADEIIAPFASAAERIHNATLIHDDVIDEAKQRRGKPTLSASGFNRRAVLAGDLLLVQALREVGKTENLLILQDLHHTLVDLVEGEWFQLEARGQANRDERHLREAARKKTASVLAWCCTTPGRLAGLSDDKIHALREFGVHFGISFQMIDDCVDFSLTSGKPFSQDLLEGQINFVTYEMMQRFPAVASKISLLLGTHITPTAAPWTPSQLETCIISVKNRASLEMNIGLEKLKLLIGSQAFTEKNWSTLQVLTQQVLERHA